MVKQIKKSQVARRKPRDSKGRFIKQSRNDERFYCVSTSSRGRHDISENAKDFFRRMSKKFNS